MQRTKSNFLKKSKLISKKNFKSTSVLMNKIKIQEPHQQILYKIDLNQITQLVL